MTLSMFVRGKVEFRHVQIWLWVSLLKEKLTLDMTKYDFEYAYVNININILCKILFITLHDYHFKNLMWNDKKV
jgi:hypothetical protein